MLTAAPLLSAQALKIDPKATAAPQSLEDRRKALQRLFDEYWQDNLRHAPEFASSLGDKRYNDQISDYSVRAYNDGLEREQKFLLRLAAIDAAGLTAQEVLSRELLMRQFTEDIEASEFKEWEMPVNQLGGIHTTYPDLVQQLTFTTVKDYDDWTARLRLVPKAFDQVTQNMAIGVEEHRVPPKFLMAKVAEQVKELAHQKPEDSPLALPLKKFPNAIAQADRDRIKAEMLAVIEKQVLPAYLRFERFMEVTYVPAAREEPGISALVDGAKYYAFCIRRSTTTNLTAEQIHQIGLDEVKRDETEMLAIAKAQGFADVKSFQASLEANPKLHPANGDALIGAYRGYIEAMEKKLPDLFGHLPKAQLEVGTIPDYLSKSAPQAYYNQGAPDGSRPGKVTVNLYNATTRSLVDVEAISYHEGVPGHHLQISIGEELEGLPEFRKFGGYTAFVEGWALYSERLGKDAGFYQDPVSDFGRLEADMWRAIRLVIDTGVHSQHWTREQMIAFFKEHSGMDDTNIQAETDRYIGWPGQALAYKVGQLKILELRDRAKKALGAKFDLKAFHDQVLDSGALPLDVLESRVDAWIAGQK